MTRGPDIAAEAARLRDAVEKRARAELRDADALAPGSDSVPWSGSLLPAVAVVKGRRGPAEASGGAALSGADGDAARKAFAAIGYDAEQLFFTLSRPEPGVAADDRARRLRMQLEAVDAALVVAVDEDAAEDVARAFGVDKIAFGVPVRAVGRRLLAVDGLEASLADAARKRRVWSQLSAARPEGPVY